MPLCDLLDSLAQSIEATAESRNDAASNSPLRGVEYRESGVRPPGLRFLAAVIRTIERVATEGHNVAVRTDYKRAADTLEIHGGRSGRENFSPLARYVEALNRRWSDEEWMPFPGGSWRPHVRIEGSKQKTIRCWIGLRDAGGQELLSVDEPRDEVDLAPLPESAQKVQQRAEHQRLSRVPDPVADFQAREEVDAVLRSIRSRTSGVVVLLKGPPGAGKREIARKAASLLREDFPEGQVYLDLTTPPGHLDSVGVRARVLLLNAISPQHRDSLMPEEHAGLYQEALRRRPILVVLENLPPGFPLHEFVPARPSAIIATSEYSFADHSIETVAVRQPANAADWLRAMCAKTAVPLQAKHASRLIRSDYAELLAILVGRLPLALRIVSSLLIEYRDLTAAQLTDRLLDEQSRVKALSLGRKGRDINELLARAEDLLDDSDVQRVLHRLALIEGPFDATAAAKIGGDPDGRAVSRLVRCSLLTFDESRGEYRMHILTRLHMRALLDEEEANAAAREHAKHFLWKSMVDRDTLLRHLPDASRAAAFLSNALTSGGADRRLSTWVANACLRIGQEYARIDMDLLAREFLSASVVHAREAGAGVTLDSAARIWRRAAVRLGDRNTASLASEVLLGREETPSWQVVVSSICAAESYLARRQLFEADSYATMAIVESRKPQLHHLATHARLVRAFIALLLGRRRRAAVLFRRAARLNREIDVDDVVMSSVNTPKLSEELGGLRRSGALDLVYLLHEVFDARPGERREMVRRATQWRNPYATDVYEVGVAHLLVAVGLCDEARERFRDAATRCEDASVARACARYASRRASRRL